MNTRNLATLGVLAAMAGTGFSDTTAAPVPRSRYFGGGGRGPSWRFGRKSTNRKKISLKIKRTRRQMAKRSRAINRGGK